MKQLYFSLCLCLSVCLSLSLSLSLSQAETDLELLPTIYLRRTKIKRTLSSIGKRPTTQIQVAAVNPGDQMGRRRELCTSLDVCDRKQANLLLDTLKETFLILLFCLIGVVYRNYAFKYSYITCLRKVYVSGVPSAGRFFFNYWLENGVWNIHVVASDQYAETNSSPNTLQLGPSPSIISIRQLPVLFTIVRYIFHD